MNAVDQIKIGPDSRKAGEILSRQTDVLNNSGSEQKSSVMISDFDRIMADFGGLHQDSAIAISLIPVKADVLSNAFIDSCWFSSPVVQWQRPAELNIRIRNNGDLDMEAVPVKLTINEDPKSSGGCECSFR